MARRRRSWLGRLLRLALLLVLGAAGWLVYYGMSALPSVPDTAFMVESGDSLSGVARKLAGQGVIDQAWSFSALGRVFGMAGRIKAGSYQVGDAKTHYGLLRKVTEGAVSLDKITIVEGWTFVQMRAALDNHPGLRHDSAGLDAAALLARVGGAESGGAESGGAESGGAESGGAESGGAESGGAESGGNGDAEGRFYPDTYYFDRGASDLDVYRRAHALMRDKLARAWQARAADLPYATPTEALIMASIVEKETGAADERPLIASVFVNRLRLGMRLQTDPTVIYGLGADFDGNLRKDDLLRDTPYNTYTRAGLPPGPIALPSGAALMAAVRPDTSRMLYFVAKGAGRHHFSENLDDHNRAVSRYQRGGR